VSALRISYKFCFNTQLSPYKARLVLSCILSQILLKLFLKKFRKSAFFLWKKKSFKDLLKKFLKLWPAGQV